jgi:hypothetical protein
MDVESIVSKPTFVADLPEVQDLKTEFIYNYYTPTESNDAGSSANQSPNSIVDAQESSVSGQAFLKGVSSLLDQSYYEALGKSKTFPRLIKVSFRPPQKISSVDLRDPSLRRKGITKRTFFNNVQIESASPAFGRLSLDIVDTGTDATVYSLFNDLKFTNEDQTVPLDNIKVDTSNSDVIIESLKKSIQPGGYNFTSDSKNLQTQNDVLSNLLKGTQTNFSILPNVANDIINASINSPKNVFFNEIEKYSINAQNFQREAIGKDPTVIQRFDYESTFVSLHETVSSKKAKLSNILVGFIVRKYSTNPDGSLREFPPNFLGPKTSSVIDPDVQFGKKYRYNIKALYLCEFSAIKSIENTQQPVIITVPFSSNGVEIVAEAVDITAPPPPVDLKFRYAADNNGLNITWNFPVNLQNDIKKFQVFRRGTFDEPFRLIRQYDFNDAFAQIPDRENVPRFLIEKSDLPVTRHQDLEFTKDSKFIYAIAAIDARGLTSNYSVQMQVSYNRYKNKLETKLISQSGAPKPYPNIYIQQDTFIDTMKMSGYSKLNVYFDPEYSKVTDELLNDLNHIIFNNNEAADNLYKLMITNTDFQKSRTLDIKINNVRRKSQPVIDPATGKSFSRS